jgi:hypothetical protein
MFRPILSTNAGQTNSIGGVMSIFTLKQPYYKAYTRVMRPPHRNENLLFKQFRISWYAASNFPQNEFL